MVYIGLPRVHGAVGGADLENVCRGDEKQRAITLPSHTAKEMGIYIFFWEVVAR